MKAAEIARLVTYIEENLRASPTAGLQFVDSRHLKSRLLSKQNHIVFGRRGAGKTSLVRSRSEDSGQLDIYLNLEDYKDITFPNILIHILLKLFQELEQHIRSDRSLWWLRPRSFSTIRRLRRTLGDLKTYVHEPDIETQAVETSEAIQEESLVGGKTHGLSAVAKSASNSSRKVTRSLPKNKIEYLRLELTVYKNILLSISELFGRLPIFLIMDDFYFVEKNTQPDLIDYFHRLTEPLSNSG